MKRTDMNLIPPQATDGRRIPGGVLLVVLLGGATAVSACGGGGGSDEDGEGPTVEVVNPLENPEDGPPAGYLDGDCGVPEEAGLEDISSPKTVIGEGTPESCTGQAVVDAVADGGVITFDCGDEPLTITLTEPAKVFNDAEETVVIDGGGKITLSGGGTTRILYMNTCDEAQHWTTSMCDNQDHPRLTVQNITFADGNSKNGVDSSDEEELLAASGGAVFASGGRFKAVNTRFFNNHAPEQGADVGGGALRVFQQYEGLPAYLVNCTFGGEAGYGNTAANGGAISSIGVSWTIINSLFSHNSAVGEGGNPAQSGTPGGGSGGAIYNDGNEMTLSLCGTLIEENDVKAYGDAIFFVTNNHTGDIEIESSIIRNNCGGEPWNPTYPGISNHDDTPIAVTDSEIVGCDE